MAATESVTFWFMGLQEWILANEEFHPLTAVFRLRADELDHIDVCGGMHASAMEMLARMLDDDAVGLLVRAIDGFVKDGLGVPTVPDDAPDDLAAALAEDGYCALPERAADPDDLAEIALDPMAVALAARHLGATPTVIGVERLRPTPKDDAFRVMMDDYRCCRQVAFLGDAPDDSGIAFQRVSHRNPWIDMLRRAWLNGVADFDQWYFGRSDKTEREVFRMFHKPPEILTGSTGSRFLFDPIGIHRVPGGLDVAMITYGLTPTRAIEGLAEPAPGPKVAPPLDYVGRLFWSAP